MTNPCALVISVFLRPVHTRRRRCVQQQLLTDKLQFVSLLMSDEPKILAFLFSYYL